MVILEHEGGGSQDLLSARGGRCGGNMRGGSTEYTPLCCSSVRSWQLTASLSASVYLQNEDSAYSLRWCEV